MGYCKVILKEAVEGLGSPLDICTVKRGYATNFLLPTGAAVLASVAELKKVEIATKKLEEMDAAVKKNAKEIIKKLSSKSIEFEEKASKSGKLYGSITEKDISDKLESDLDVKISTKFIKLQKHIKDLGETEVEVKITDDDSTSITVIVKEAK